MSGFEGAFWASMPVPALLLDPADAVAEANAAAEDLLNVSLRWLRGRPVLDRLEADVPLADLLAQVRRKSAPVIVSSVSAGAPMQPAHPVNLRIAPMQGMPGFVLLMLEPRHMADRLGAVGGGGRAARSAIGMSEMLAHEIKNPLAGITGAAQLLGMTLAAEDRALTDLIVAESRRIVALLDQVEQFGNLRPPARDAVNVHDLLDRVVRTASVGFAGHMRFVTDYDPSLPWTHVDADQIIQVVLNLVRNATEASGPAGGTIALRTFYDPGLRLRRDDGPGPELPLQVEIADDGPGLPPEIAEHAWDPFVSGRENGTGLGLALVGKIVADHDAWITLSSRPGRTAFRLSLPRAPETGRGHSTP